MHATSYAMAWSVGTGPRKVGRVELERDRLTLGELSVDLKDVRSVQRTRDVLVVQRDDADPVRIVSLDRPGTLRELADFLLECSDVPA